MELPFGLDQSLRSTDDRLNGTPHSGGRTKKTVAEAQVFAEFSKKHFDWQVEQTVSRYSEWKWAWLINFCAQYYNGKPPPPPFKKSCIRHWCTWRICYNPSKLSINFRHQEVTFIILAGTRNSWAFFISTADTGFANLLVAELLPR